MLIPDALIPVYLRLTHANAPFMTAEGAEKEVHEQALRPVSHRPPANVRAGVRITVERDGGVPVYTVIPRADLPLKHVIYAHGGGWVHEISPQHWALIVQIAAEARAAVTVPIWTLLPYGDATQALELMLHLHEKLQHTGRDVLIAGGSAGGQIALSAAQAIRDRGTENVRTILISPALDLTVSNPQIPSVLPKDPWLGVEGTRHLAERWRGAIPITDPRVSPLFGDMHGLGPMFLACGTHDILNPDAHLLLGRARASGVEVTFLERAGGLHVFPLLPTRTGRAARARIVEAIRS
ncbi:alpha/beta hydrolase [Amnibacterium sp. CER49]|uniref:alpha/beta hydrolase n=1 Tax=Amnibacterium sp. CER49 TaxID=3039161 RepID=UPI002448CBCA|nr:alpha/beta hydrolase [Amnibacterium sp. CER49]MDH2445138.1 alpha/beta hydrolase [Amnibacterium sp. CER49]